jgi:hypothetical protein
MLVEVCSFTAAMGQRAMCLGAAIALLCTAPAPAWAGAADPAAEAKELFQQARAALKLGEHAEALVLLRKSHRRFPKPGTLLNMAECEDRLGLIASAYQHFQELTTMLPADDKRFSLAQKRAAELEPWVPRLRIDLASGVPTSTSVIRDRTEVGPSSLGVELPVDPGEHVIVVTAPGRAERLYRVKLGEGARENMKVEPGQKIAKDTAKPVHGPPTAGIVLASVGGLALIVGGVTGGLAIAKKNEVAVLCPQQKQCSPLGLTVEATGKGFATASTAAFAVGLSALGVGTYLVLSNRGKPTTTTALAPLMLPGGAGLGASGAF